MPSCRVSLLYELLSVLMQITNGIKFYLVEHTKEPHQNIRPNSRLIFCVQYVTVQQRQGIETAALMYSFGLHIYYQNN